MDLKTAFLQGEEYDNCRDVVCQLPPEAGHPPHIAARLKKPAYGMNDAPRRWWNKVDSSLRSYGMIPTRADRCCYVLYDKPQAKTRTIGRPPSRSHSGTSTLDEALDYLMGPISGSPAYEGTVQGIICLHVDDLFITGGAEMKKEYWTGFARTSKWVQKTQMRLSSQDNGSGGMARRSLLTKTRPLRNCL
jgi:hypothetical protein